MSCSVGLVRLLPLTEELGVARYKGSDQGL